MIGWKSAGHKFDSAITSNTIERMARVYGLYTEQMCWYVGSTITSLKRRGSEHRTPKNSAGSHHIPKDFQWEIRLIEECSIENRTARERYWYEELKPFYNNQVPGRTKKEYDAIPEVKEKKAAAQRARQATLEGKERNAAAHRAWYARKKAELLLGQAKDLL